MMKRTSGLALALTAAVTWACGPSQAPSPGSQRPAGTLPFTEGYAYVAWNARRAPWKSAEVRRSMTSFVDRRSLAERLAGDPRAVTEGPVHPADPRHVSSIVSPPFDPDLAAHGLRDAGLSRVGSGPWTSRGGVPVEVVLLCGEGDLARQTAFAVADALTQGGFSVEAQALSDDELAARVTAGDFDAVVLFRPPGRPLDLAAEFGSEGPGNPTRFSDGPLDALLGGGDATFDQAYRRIVELQPRVFLFYLRPSA